MIWLDEYERRARLAPGLLALLPVAVSAVVLGYQEIRIASSLVGLLVGVGGPVVLAGLVRERGLKAQKLLFSDWDGSPTTKMLRLRNGEQEAGRVLDRRRQQLEQLTGVELPNVKAEASDPVASDAEYGHAVQELKSQTYDKSSYPLVFAENRDYGFARNLFALRGVGISVAILGLAVNGIAMWIAATGNDAPFARLETGIGAAICAALAVFWWVIPTEKSVRVSAERYAKQLFAALPGLASKS